MILFLIFSYLVLILFIIFYFVFFLRIWFFFSILHFNSIFDGIEGLTVNVLIFDFDF